MGLLGPLRGEPMLFLLSLVGEGGAGFPICNNRSHKILNDFKTSHGWVALCLCPHCTYSQWLKSICVFIVIVQSTQYKDQLLMDWGSHARRTAEQSQAITLVLLYTELSIKAAFLMLAWEVMRRHCLREMAPQIAGQVSRIMHGETACQRKPT